MKPIIYLLLISCFFSCIKESKNHKTALVEIEQEIDILDTLSLKLNDGNKWVVNTETHAGIEKMDSILSRFKASNSNDFIGLGQHLSIQTGFVIRNCSMKGESHDQLHVVLVPMLDEISILKETEDSVQANLAVTKLNLLITNYFKHFKL